MVLLSWFEGRILYFDIFKICEKQLCFILQTWRFIYRRSQGGGKSMSLGNSIIRTLNPALVRRVYWKLWTELGFHCLHCHQSVSLFWLFAGNIFTPLSFKYPLNWAVLGSDPRWDWNFLRQGGQDRLCGLGGHRWPAAHFFGGGLNVQAVTSEIYRFAYACALTKQDCFKLRCNLRNFIFLIRWSISEQGIRFLQSG